MPWSERPPRWFSSAQVPRSLWFRFRGDVQFPQVEQLRSGLVMRDFQWVPAQVWLFRLYDGMFVTTALIVPLAFLFTPTSRRRAKVRWRHLYRIMVYTLAFPLLVMFLQIATIVVTYNDLGWLEYRMRWVWPYIALVIGPVLLYVWWCSAIRHYLKMPHARTLAAASVAIAVLVTWMMLLAPAALID